MSNQYYWLHFNQFQTNKEEASLYLWVGAILSSFHLMVQLKYQNFPYVKINNSLTNKLLFVRLVHKTAICVSSNKFVYRAILTDFSQEINAIHVEVNWMVVWLVVVAKSVLPVTRIKNGKLRQIKMENVNAWTLFIMIKDHVRHVKSF